MNKFCLAEIFCPLVWIDTRRRIESLDLFVSPRARQPGDSLIEFDTKQSSYRVPYSKVVSLDSYQCERACQQNWGNPDCKPIFERARARVNINAHKTL